MIVGDKVRVIAAGEFHNFTGTIVSFGQFSARSRVFYRIVFDSHPWQREGISWAFERHELEAI